MEMEQIYLSHQRLAEDTIRTITSKKLLKNCLLNERDCRILSISLSTCSQNRTRIHSRSDKGYFHSKPQSVSRLTNRNSIQIKRRKTFKQAEIPISERMSKIIAKYRNLSPYGYIFPIVDDKKEKLHKKYRYQMKKF